MYPSEALARVGESVMGSKGIFVAAQVNVEVEVPGGFTHVIPMTNSSQISSLVTTPEVGGDGIVNRTLTQGVPIPVGLGTKMTPGAGWFVLIRA